MLRVCWNWQTGMTKDHVSTDVRTYAGLDQLAFVGFEDEPFIDDIVQLSAFDALAEDEEEADVEECGQGDDK